MDIRKEVVNKVLKAEVVKNGKIRYYNDDDLFAGYYVVVERKTIDLPDDAGGPTTFGMVYVTTPEEGPHALMSPDEPERLAEGLTEMLSAAGTIARLMDNSDDAA